MTVETVSDETAPARGGRRPSKNAASSGSADDQLVQVVSRNAFYKDGYANLKRIAIAELIAIALLSVALVISVFFVKPDQRYFATSEDGRIIPLVPVSQPNLSDAAVIAWAVESVTETMTFGFHDWRYRLSDSMRHFTLDGRQSFTRALDQSGRLDAMEARRQVMSASLDQSPIILNQGFDQRSGRYFWQLQGPMRLTVLTGDRQQTELFTLSLIIVRESTLNSERGLAIQQWIAAPA